MRASIKQLPDQKVLLELLNYDPVAGDLKWRHSRGSQLAGQYAGTITMRGYLHVGISFHGKRIYYLAQRVIWKLIESTRAKLHGEFARYF